MRQLTTFTQALSIGASCQGAHQIRRVTGSERASVFDWLGTPHDGLVQVLRTDFAGAFARKNLCLSQDETTVLDVANGLSYRHMFRKRPGTNVIDPKSISEDYDRRRQKLEFLQLRWREDLSRHRTLFVRQDAPTSEQAVQLANALAIFTQHQPFLLLVLTPSPGACNSEDPRIAVEPFAAKSQGAFGWQGVDTEWDRVLARYLSLKEELSRERPAVSFELRPERATLAFSPLLGV